MQLTAGLIQLNSSAPDKQTAIEQVAQLLIANGKVQQEYVQGMFQREQQANTYLGNGVAIPHGTPETRRFINETAIAIVQIPAGISWGEGGERVQLVVGIAASDSEHLGILRQLTRLLNNREQLQQLVNTSDKNLIIKALAGEGTAAASGDASAPLEFQEKVVIPNPLGFHARPATNLAKAVKASGSQVFLRKSDGQRADAAKMMGVLALAIGPGEEITVESDSAAALQQIITQIRSGLGDDLSEKISEAPKAALWQPPGEVRALVGICASEGLAIGQIRHYQSQSYEIDPRPSELSAWEESKRLNQALDSASRALEALSRQSEIFGAHLALLKDEDLLTQAVRAISQGQRAEAAYFAACNEQIKRFQASGNPVFAARATDIQDLRDRVVRLLLGLSDSQLDFQPDTILCADNLTPSDTAKLNPLSPPRAAPPATAPFLPAAWAFPPSPA